MSLLCGLLLALLAVSTASAAPLSAKKEQLRQVQARLQTVYRQADIAVERYNQATTQLQAVDARVTANESLLAVAERNLELARQQLAARAQSIYKSREVGVIDVLLSASDFDNLIADLDMMRRLGNSDVDTVKSFIAYEQDVRDRRTQLVADRKAAAKLVEAAAEHKAEVVGVQTKLEQMTAGIRGEIERLQEQAAARAKAAAEAASVQDASGDSSSSGDGSSDTVVDPGGSGHSAVVAIAQRYLGVPYLRGGSGPSGFDCSGLAMYCYAQAGIGIPRGATDQQHASTPVPISALQPGDLVFFGSASYSHHVSIYGGGSMIHAPHKDSVVSYGSISGAWIGGRP